MVARLQGAKGVLHLVTLLREPHREFHVFDLLAMTDGVPANDLRAGQYEAQVPQLRSSSESSDTHPLPDRQARIVYQQRLRDLREELGEAERFNDPARVSKLRNEIDFLTHELTAAYGTESHARKRNEDVEKVRKTVTHRIRTALLKIKKAHPPLWRHLFAALKTGTFCSYSPEKLTKWEV